MLRDLVYMFQKIQLKILSIVKRIRKPRVLIEIKNAVKDDKIRSNFKFIYNY